MEKYSEKINIVVAIPGMTLTHVPLSSYEIDEWIGKCEDIEVLEYLRRSITKHIGVIRQDGYDYDVMK